MPDTGWQMADGRSQRLGNRVPGVARPTPETRYPRPECGDTSSVNHRTTAWLLVVAQFVLIGAVVVLPGDHWQVTSIHQAITLALIGVALALGLWAARWLGAGLTPLPLPNGRVDLVVHGPYRWVRHPMYSAVIIGMGGIAVRSGSWWSAGAWLALVVLLAVKSRWEERHLVTAFPGYEAYRTRTGRFMPGLG